MRGRIADPARAMAHVIELAERRELGRYEYVDGDGKRCAIGEMLHHAGWSAASLKRMGANIINNTDDAIDPTDIMVQAREALRERYSLSASDARTIQLNLDGLVWWYVDTLLQAALRGLQEDLAVTALEGGS